MRDVYQASQPFQEKNPASDDIRHHNTDRRREPPARYKREERAKNYKRIDPHSARRGSGHRVCIGDEESKDWQKQGGRGRRAPAGDGG